MRLIVQRILGHGGWIVLLGLLPHLPGLFGGFVYDDLRFVTDNDGVHDLRAPWELVASIERTSDPVDPNIYRPLRTVGFALQYSLFGPRPAGFHATSLALHAGIVLLLFSWIQHLRPGDHWLPGIAALWFSVHPLTVETVAWISSQGDLLATGFGLFALLAATRWHKSRAPEFTTLDFTPTGAPQPSTVPTGQGALLAASSLVAAGFTALALLGKESAVALPAVLLVLALRLAAGRRRASDFLPGLLSLGVLIVYLFVRQRVLERGFSFDARGFAQADQPWTAALFRCAQNWNRLLATFALPRTLSIDYGDGFLRRPNSLSLIVAILSFSVCGWWSHRPGLHANLRRIAFWSAVGFFLPTSGLVPTRNPTAERFYQPALPGLVLLGASLVLEQIASRESSTARRVIAVLLAVYLGVLSVRTVVRTLDFRSQRSLFEAELRVHPESTQALLGVGEVDWTEGRVESAKQRFLEVVARLEASNPRRIGARANLGGLAEERGDIPGALDQYRAACLESKAAGDPRSVATPLAWIRLGSLLRKSGSVSEAEQVSREGLEIFGEIPELCELLGTCLDQQGNPAAAQAQYRKALAAKGPSATLHYHLALALHHQHRDSEARAELQLALQLAPDLPSARRLLAELELDR